MPPPKLLRFSVYLLFLACALQAQTLVSTQSVPFATASTATTGTFSTTTGDALVGMVRHDTQTLSSVQTFNGAGNSCTIQQTKSDVSQVGIVDIFYCQNINGHGSDSVKATLTGSSVNFAVVLLQYSGMLTSGVFDQVAYGFNASSFNTQTTAAFTTTATHEVIVGCIGIDVARGDQHGTGYVARVNDVNNTASTSGLWCEDKTVTTIQTGTTATFTGIDRFMIFGISLKAIPPPALAITKTHSGNFTQGDTGKTYTVTVSNLGEGVTSGTVTMTETPPSGLTVTAMSGTGWTCNTVTCTRSDVLASLGTYPAITVTVSVGATAQSPQVNSVTVSGGGSPSATANDSTVINTSGSLVVTVTRLTQTQIVVNYTATSGSACTVAATDLNGGPDVSDINAAKFTNANLDLSRTYANGYRWPTLVSGLNRTVTIGGHDEIKLGTDSKWYSTALQVNSANSITVVCDLINGGTITATTRNLPLASNYPEMPIATPGSPLGGMPQPTIDWSRAGRSKTYTDPMTGVLTQRITGGNDFFTDAPQALAGFQTPVIDVNGSAWTNPDNLKTNQVAGTLATTSTVNAPLFAAFTSAFAQDPTARWSDFLLVPYGSASSNTIVATWGISLDSGQTWANYTPIDVTYTTSAQCQPAGNCSNSIPSNTPGSFFDGWGLIKTAFGSEDLLNRSIAGVSASGSTVTIITPTTTNGPSRFYMGLVPGSKFMMTACGVGTQATPLTVATVNSQSSITTVEGGLALTNCTYTDMHAGIRVVMKNAGTLNASFQMTGYQAREFGGGTSGAHYNTAKTKVTDITTDCDGGDHTGAPLSGYLAQFGVRGNSAIFLIQDNGRMCLQSNLYSPTAPLHLNVNTVAAWVGNNAALGTDQQSPAHLWKATHVAGNYQEMPVDLHPSPDVVDTKMTYTDLGVAQANNGQVVALGGPAGTAAATGLWPAFTFETVLDDHTGTPILQFNSSLGGGDGSCMKAWATLAGTVISTMPPYGSYPLSYTACHAAPVNGGGYAFVGTRGADNSLAPYKFDTGTVLGGPFAAEVIGVRKNGSWVNSTITISSCTKANPAVCTATANNLDNIAFLTGTTGAPVVISGATGTGWATNLNGKLYAHNTDNALDRANNNTFSLSTDPQGTGLDSTGFGTLGGTITATLSKPIYSLHIASVSNSGGNARITIDNTEGGPVRTYPSISSGIANIMFDADPITIVQTYLNSTTQYYAKVSCSGCSSTQFDVYSDSALTTPVAFGSLSGTGGYYVLYAERCPDPATVTLPGPMFTDTQFGTTGAGNQKIRCVGIRLASEMESNFPGTGEHAAYLPPATSSEFTNVKKSMLHQINMGDGMMDMSHVGFAHEIFYTLSVDRSVSENQIDVVVERAYGDDPNYLWRGTTNNARTDTYAMQHSPGWTAVGTGIVASIILDPSVFPVTYLVPQLNGAHADLVSGSTLGTITTAGGYDAGSPDDVIDGSITTYVTTFTTTHNSHPVWAADATAWSALGQSYPSKRNIVDQTPAAERIWKTDWAAPNIASGTGKNAMDGTGLTRTLTNVSGIVWKIGSLTATNIKVSPVFVSAIPYNYFTDKSGPGSALGGGDNGKFCYAYNAGECVGGSLQGDLYIASTTLQTAGLPGGQCITNDATVGAPCAYTLWPGMGWALQIRQTPIDTNAAGFRRLTQGFWPGMGQYYASNWVASSDGKYGFFASNPLGQRPKAADGGSDFFAMKLPPWPIRTDGVDRTTYVQLPVACPTDPACGGLGGVSGDNIRISFGYGENGNPASFYGTTRLEKTWTSSTASGSNPFVFDSEAQHKTSCDTTCTINVPAIPGRLVWIQVERTNGASTALGPITVFDTGGVTDSVGPGSTFGGKIVMGGKAVIP